MIRARPHGDGYVYTTEWLSEPAPEGSSGPVPREPAFCAQLDAAMDTLVARAEPVTPGQNLLENSDWYSESSAWLDELWQ